MTSSLSTAHLLRVITGARIGVWSWDVARQSLEWSPVCLELFGVGPATEVSYEQWLDYVHADDRDDVRRAVQHAIQHRAEFNCDYRVVWPDGSVHWLTSFAQPVVGSTGDVASLEGFLREITQRKQAEMLASERDQELGALQARLAQRAVDAETADRAKHAFLRNVSHELRTPLNHILGGVDVLREETHSAEQEPWLDIISQSGRHLLGMIEQIIATTTTEAGSVVVQTRRFSLRALLRDSVAPLLDRIAGKELKFDLQMDRALPAAVIGDPTLIAQALLNYLDNAIRFAPPASVITVSAELESSDDSRVQVRLDVIDRGPGVPAEVLTVLFSEFDCDDTAVHRLHGGLGMGLARTRKLAIQLGGKVGFESRPGHGARFWLSVPLRRPDASDSK